MTSVADGVLQRICKIVRGVTVRASAYGGPSGELGDCRGRHHLSHGDTGR